MAAAAVLFAMLLTTAVWADSSTTTSNTAYKDLSANTEIYAVSDSGSACYYGAMWEPKSGTYYGRVARGGPVSNGWGLVNGDGLQNESACSFYYSLGDTNSLQAYSYIFSGLLDGNRMLLINLNFEQEANDCTAILNGTYDAQLTETLKYLSGLSCPVLLRIGGEVNVWSNMPAGSKFVSAYRYVANLARRYASNVALVYSVNFSSKSGVDLDSFYPGDSYVDWIGVSLYYNRYANNGDTSNDKFYGVNTYGDAMLNVQQTVNLSRLHKKPIVVTEGGSTHYYNGTDTSQFAAERVGKAYAFLSMVYPEIKCMIYSDTDFGGSSIRYSLQGSSTVTAAYNSAVSANPSLLHSLKDAGKSYVPASGYTVSNFEKVRLAAYTYSSSHLSAKWYLDGVLQTSTSQYPYSYTLNTEKLASKSGSSHTVRVEFSNGESRSWSFKLPAVKSDMPFEDVLNPNSWFYEPVRWAVDREITAGTTNVTFSPEWSCTRAQVVAFLWRANGRPEPSTTVNPFTDVKASDYYYKAVLWAVENGIVYGTSDTTFSPNSACTRAQVAAFLYRAKNSPEPKSNNNPFKDVKSGAYYYKAVMWAVENGIVYGTSNTTFEPNATCTRAQCVSFLYRTYAK